MSARKTYIPVFMLLSALALPLAGCASIAEFLGFGYTPPEVELRSIEVKNFSFGALKLEVRLLVKNPNTFALKISKLDYAVNVQDSVIASGAFENMFEVPREGQNEIRLPLNLDANAAMRLINAVLEKPKDEVLADVMANMEFETPIGRMTKEFKQQKSLNKLNISK